MERIKEDRPITIKDDKGNLNRCIADIVSVRCRGSAAVVLGAASVVLGGWEGSRLSRTSLFLQLFITVMDKLRLEIRAMDEVGFAHVPRQQQRRQPQFGQAGAVAHPQLPPPDPAGPAGADGDHEPHEPPAPRLRGPAESQPVVSAGAPAPLPAPFLACR